MAEPGADRQLGGTQRLLLQRLIETALAEDLGVAGDITSDAVIPTGFSGQALLVSREAGVLSGTEAVDATFALVDPSVQVDWQLRDGEALRPDQLVASISGNVRSLLLGERVALNLLGRLTGIATATAELVKLVAGTSARVVDTRKTTPGLRALEKRAVLHGGGCNHRFGLYDAILVKDNHIALGGGLDAVLMRLAEARKHLVRVECEVDSLEQLARILEFDAARVVQGLAPVVHAVLLDNFSAEAVAQGVALARTHPASLVVEVSGGVTKGTIRQLALAGPDLISVGALTHSVRCHDFGLDVGR